HEDRSADLALLPSRVRDGVLHGGDEDVTDLSGRPGGRRQHTDHRELTRPGVIRATNSCVRPDHSSAFSSVVGSSSSRSGVRISVTPSCSSSAFSMSATRGAAAPASPAREMTSTSRQRFVALNRRLSWLRTRSPALARALAGAFAGAAARVAAAFAGAFARVAAFAVVFFSVFSAIRLTLNRSLAHHREQAGDLSACVRHRAEVLELPRGELELRIE